MFFAVVVVERDLEFVGESVGDGGADAETGERAWAAVESDFLEVLESFVVFLKMILESF